MPGIEIADALNALRFYPGQEYPPNYRITSRWLAARRPHLEVVVCIVRPAGDDRRWEPILSVTETRCACGRTLLLLPDGDKVREFKPSTFNPIRLSAGYTG